MAAMKQSDGVSLSALLADMADELPAVKVHNITSDSRLVTPGTLFLACRGVGGHGLEFLSAALEAGAAVVAWEPEEGLVEPKIPASVVSVPVSDLGDKVGLIADRFFAQPSAAMNLAGITGTNGKTTVAWLVSQALSLLAGRTAYMGTLGYGVLPELKPSALTTPGCIAVHRRLRELLDQQVSGAVLEVSSHALDQGRIDGVRLNIAAFTNLSRDHLDYHGDLDAYKAAKASLFSVSSLEAAVINVGDSFGAQLAGELDGDLRVFTVALAGSSVNAVNSTVDLLADYSESPDGLQLDLSGAFGEAQLVSSLAGIFNAENLLVATGLIVAQGYTLGQAITALQAVTPPPGRMQRISAPADAPTVFVDFAHTPDALAKVLESVKAHYNGKLICVFGCGGDRDQGKRGQMGAIAAQYADHVVVTNDNPRSEDPQQIMDDIVAGMDAGASYEVIPDRAAAITAAVCQGVAEDVVVIAGKGSENVQIIGDKTTKFSDADVAAKALASASGGAS
ncbi:MAG: UDP-N-acetylmuramoyl-L-alanyl-D-glutamate--2,6-diaminopimelate ligase [Gammaproteobacteria bacterium]